MQFLLPLTGVLGVFSIKNGILLDFSWTFVSEFVVSGVVFYLRFREQYKLRLEIKKQFEHYLDPRQIKQLQDNPDLLKLGGEKILQLSFHRFARLHFVKRKIITRGSYRYYEQNFDCPGKRCAKT